MASRSCQTHIAWRYRPTVVALGNPLALPIDVIYQNILTQAAGCGVKRPASADAGHLLDEMDQIVIIRQHKGVDSDLAAPATLCCQLGLFQNGGMETPRMNEQPSVDAR